MFGTAQSARSTSLLPDLRARFGTMGLVVVAVVFVVIVTIVGYDVSGEDVVSCCCCCHCEFDVFFSSCRFVYLGLARSTMSLAS